MLALVATDGSDAANVAARTAMEQLPADACFVVVSVAPDRDDGMEYAGGFEGPLNPDDDQRVEQEAMTAANGAVAVTAEALLPHPVETRVVRGSAGPAICDLAEELDADVGVLGEYRRNLVSRLVLGSVTDLVVHHCTRPVLVVPAPPRDG
jgi:nucleotide-binding universal stress UspA family protein